MSCDRFEAMLGDYVDGTLQGSGTDAGVLASLDAHLASCRRCRAAVDDLRAIRAAARNIEPHEPPPEVWTRIASALEQQPRRGWWARFSSWESSWQALAAAAVLVVALAGTSWVVWQQVMQPTSEQTTLEAVTLDDPAESVEAQRRAAEEEYIQTIAGLEEITTAGGDELDSETADVLQASLTVIDEAIGESRAALESEPSNELAQDSLFEAFRVKVTLLHDTIALINEMRQGNQEGAARIASGLNQ